MTKPVIAIASDHAGVELKSAVKQWLKEYADTVIDLGPDDAGVSVDYSDYGNKLAETVLAGKAQFGVAICGSGIGISIAANRHKGIRAALCHSGISAALSRQHNNANVLCLGARLLSTEVAKECVQQFFTTAFEGGRHERRVEKLG
ncbi:MAG TPA: ribose 5-phosphate isomerase B [Rickettsiales bacterium]|nr:ribose 5-phosphate isomerase B [Rickettsiales bacterium]